MFLNSLLKILFQQPVKDGINKVMVINIPSDGKRYGSFYGRSLVHAVNVFALLLGVFVLLSAAVQVSAEESDREVLKGLQSIGIKIDRLSRKARALGITYESVTINIVSKLRQAGIKVVSSDVLQKDPSLSFLKISLMLDYNDPKYKYTVVVGLNERVYFEKDPQIISYAMPWWRIVKGEDVGDGDVAKHVLETLQYIINEFIANYNEVNPKENSPEMKNEEQQQGAHLEDKHEQVEKNIKIKE